MATMSWNPLTIACLLMMTLLAVMVITTEAVPIDTEVSEEEKTELPHVETIDEIIINAAGGEEAEGNAESKRKNETGEEVEGYDMVLTPEQAEILHGNSETGVSKRRIANFVTMWTDAEVPYEWGLLAGNGDWQALMQEAFDEWETHTCIRFVPAQASHQHKIKFIDNGGCSSYLGMTHWSEQKVSLGNGCHTKGTYLHELGHALGLVHEHQLPQRDSFITVDTNNIKPGLEDQFTKYSTEVIPNAEQAAYSYKSIMHYGIYAFSTDYGTLQTIVPLDSSQEIFMGKGSSLAFSDAKVINLMYNCAGRCNSPPSVCQDPCFVNENCQCICEQDMPYPCENQNANCDAYAGYGFCTGVNENYMKAYCMKACNFCS